MSKELKKIIIINLGRAFLFSALFFAPGVLWAQTSATSTAIDLIKVTPQIIDLQTKAKEMSEYVIKITNNQTTQTNIYPLVNDLTDDGQIEYNDPKDLDKTKSLTRWIEIPRGKIEIPPGESAETSLKINVNMNAQPGIYHAVLTFAQANGLLDAAEKARSSKQATLIINVVVAEDIIEKAEVEKFQSLKNIYFSWPVIFNLNIKNLGNRPVVHGGFINIYDRQGRELAALELNNEQRAIPPAESDSRTFSWSPAKGLGKYSAKLNAEYGDKVKRDLNDTIYFWILPWPFLTVIGLAAVIFIILITVLIFRKTRIHEYQPTSDGVINLKSK